jgi:hypothetical protein
VLLHNVNGEVQSMTFRPAWEEANREIMAMTCAERLEILQLVDAWRFDRRSPRALTSLDKQISDTREEKRDSQ